MESDPSVTPAREAAGPVRFGEFTFDPATAELWRDGAPIDLPPQPGTLLALLVRRPGRLITRRQIREHVWDDAVVEFDQAINNAVRQVRDILGDDASDPHFVATVPRRGYRFIASVEPANATPGTGGVETEGAAGRESAYAGGGEVVTGRAPVPRARLAIYALLVVTAVLTAWLFAGPTSDEDRRTVVAVVPARAPVSDSASEALATSVTSAVTGALEAMESRGMEVVPWTADMWYDRERHSVLRDGRRADVDFAVETSVYPGEKLEIALSLVRFPGGRQVWYRRFEHSADETRRAEERATEALVEIVGENLATSNSDDP